MHIFLYINVSISQKIITHCCVTYINMEVELISNHNHHEVIRTCNNEISTNLEKTINQIIKRQGFLKYEIDKRSLSPDGGNYLSTLHEFNVKGRTKDGDKEIHIFVKQIIDIGDHHVISLPDLFNYELFAYKELFKIFESLQENANVPHEEKYKMVKVYDESNPEAIILENLGKKGFTVYDRMEVVSLKFAEKSIIELAKFHALSIVLKEKEPEYFERKLKSIKYPMNFEEDWVDMVKQSRNSTIDYVDEEFKEIVERAYNDIVIKHAQYQKDESIRVCLCHGDYKPNNILVKEANGEVNDLIPVDFQLIHFGCPIFDFFHFIFLGTDRDFRKANMLNLKELYYETFCNFLNYFDLDGHVVYSRKEFDKVFKEKLDYGLYIALIFLPYVFTSNEYMPDMSKDISEMTILVDGRLKNRINGLIQDFIDWGYLSP